MANKRRDPEPANDDHPSKPAPASAKPAIVTTTSRKRVKLLRAEERTAELDDPAPDPRPCRDAGVARTRQMGPRTSEMTVRPRSDTGGATATPRCCPARRPWTSPSARAAQRCLRRRAEPSLVAQRTNRSSRFASLLSRFSAQHCRAGCSAEILAPARWGGGPLE
jgi:hypothetical protein